MTAASIVTTNDDGLEAVLECAAAQLGRLADLTIGNDSLQALASSKDLAAFAIVVRNSREVVR